MNTLTFKQFNLLSELAEIENHDELLARLEESIVKKAIGAIKGAMGALNPSDEKLQQLQQDLASKDPRIARTALKALTSYKGKDKLKAELIAKAGKKSIDQRNASTNAKMNQAKAETEVADRGSSHAYDKETGTVRSKSAPRWDKTQNKWVKD